MELFLFLLLSVLLFRALGRGHRRETPGGRPRTDTWVDGVVDAVLVLTDDVLRGARTLARLAAAHRERTGRSPWT
ncbi:hypothetical protein [Modestobacter italicus]|uniref:hypothetical protein n=1 Tax=Modestobacter italicus (strain DSM 44449 / CECT 9708 / BC 501) TaxID=2732864 RepID=UPI001C943906|nr:hypothetical protein [Modestobacter italicus]